MGWTNEQNQVIKARNCNLLVSAAAGSGKTAVLVERIIERITQSSHPINIDELLVVTFTKAAAAEMKERILKAIDKKRMEQPENSHLKKQASLIHTAKIMTIDSFCLDVIRNYFHHIDLDPGFRIGNEAELTLLKSDVLSGVIEQYYESLEEEFVEFIECYTGTKSDKRLEEYILRLYNFSMSYPWPIEWLKGVAEQFKYKDIDDFYTSPPIIEMLNRVKSMISDAYKLNETAFSICRQISGPYMYEDALASDKQILDMLLTADTYLEMHELISDISFMTLSRKKDADVSQDLREQVKDIRNEVKGILNDLKKSFFYQSSEDMYNDIIVTEPSMKVLCQITIDFIHAFAKTKREKNIIDFHDMEHFALEILINRVDGIEKPSKAAKDIRSQYVEIMIDEYQDSNYVQEKILTSISRESIGEPNIFMVGDVKQSIYKFRLAKPELFMDKYAKYSDSEEGACRKIDLHKNFRSRSEVLDSVNEIFYNIMRKEFGGIEYDAKARLYTGADYDVLADESSSYVAELLLVTDNEEYGCEYTDDLGISKAIYNAEIEEDEDYGKKELEAYAIARRIKELTNPKTGMMITKKIDGHNELRPAKLRDIVILLRTMTGWSELFIEILAEEGIRAYAETKTGYFQTIEIKTMRSLLMVLDNPLQDIPFTAVLYSPFAGLSSEELAKLRIQEKKRCMYEAAKVYLIKGDDIILKEKLEEFFKLYDDLRNKSFYMTVKELIIEILSITKYDYYVLAMPFGEQRKRNLDMLIKQAAEYEETSWHGLFQFVRYIDRLIKYDIDYGESGGFSEQDDAVRIMSIHKSKGLEFPIVFAAGMSKKFNMSDARASLILHPELGIGPDCIDYKLRTKAPTLLKKIIQHNITEENLSEETRVLYVAMTRAKEKLIMSGYVDDIEKAFEKWNSKAIYNRSFLNHHLLKAGSFLDYLGPCIANGNKTNIKIMHAMDIINKKAKEKWKIEKLTADFNYKLNGHNYNKDINDILLDEINYTYPYIKEVELPIKMSVSTLKKLSMEDEVSYKVDESNIDENNVDEGSQLIKNPIIPKFLDDKKELRADSLGTLHHKMMELFDYAGYADAKLYKISPSEYVNQQIDSFMNRGLLTEDEKNQLYIDKFIKFFETGLSLRMASAAKAGLLYKEQRFVIKRPAKELISSYEGMEDILVQGIFDAYFEEDEKVVLIDYKTDYVPDNDDNYLKQKYEIQLASYEKALRQLTGKEIKDIYIYSFYMSKSIKL